MANTEEYFALNVLNILWEHADFVILGEMFHRKVSVFQSNVMITILLNALFVNKNSMNIHQKHSFQTVRAVEINIVRHVLDINVLNVICVCSIQRCQISQNAEIAKKIF